MEFIKACWMHKGDLGQSKEDIRRVFQKLAKHNFSMVFLFVKDENSGVIYPTSRNDARFVMQEGRDPLEEAVAIAHEYGIQLHATFVVFNEGIWKSWEEGSLPGWWLSQHLELIQVDRNGRKISRWADPAKEDVRIHEKGLILEVAKKYEVDGIQLDYIRYPEEAEGCFCDFCRSKFFEKYGIDPTSIVEPDYKRSLWINWRAENITSFVRELREELRKINSKLKLSAAVFKDYPRCLINVAQDWVTWISEELVDFVCPMTYEYDQKVARYLARTHRAIVGKGRTIYEGIGKRSSQSILSPKEVYTQAKIFKEEGADGIVIFSLSSLTDEDFNELDKV